ncbi:MAG: glycosyltransferase family 4 protein [Cyanophyceae cyanobacterium]
MRIAVIGAKGLPAKQGGIERYCQELYPRLVAQGHSVDLFARPSYTQAPWFSTYDYQGVRVLCLPSCPWRGLDALASSALGAIAALFKSYDIVHFHALGPALFCWLPRLNAAKIVVTCQGLDWQRAKWGRISSAIIHAGEKSAARYADRIVVVSKDLQAYFQKTYGLDTHYIPNGPGRYDESDPNFAYVKSLQLTPKRYLLFLGRLVPEKRPDLLLAAFRSLNPQGWKLVLTGGISDTGRFAAKIQALAANRQDILFTGELQGRQLAEIVRGAGLFVLPSDLEGLPLVMLEAMAEGIPVLASNIPPHRQLISQERGLLFEAGDVESCVGALQHAVCHPRQLQSMARTAQQHVQENYSWQKITADNLALYTNLLSDTARSEEAAPLTDREQRLQACLLEAATLLCAEVDSDEFRNREHLETVLRQQLNDQVSAQLDRLYAQGQSVNQLGLK